MIGGSVSRVLQQRQPRFFRKLASFLDIARRAAGGQVFPVGFSTARLWYDVIESDLVRLQRLSTILAEIAVPDENVVLRSNLSLKRNVDKVYQPDYGRRGQHAADRSEYKVRGLLHDGNTLEDHNDSAADVADVDRLVGCIQDKNAAAQSSC